MPVSFSVTKRESLLIQQLASRAVKFGVPGEMVDIEMDLTAVHANGCPLNLEKMIGATEFDFMHDVLGIRKHLDRQTGKLRDCFVPRCASQPTPAK